MVCLNSQWRFRVRRRLTSVSWTPLPQTSSVIGMLLIIRAPIEMVGWHSPYTEFCRPQWIEPGFQGLYPTDTVKRASFRHKSCDSFIVPLWQYRHCLLFAVGAGSLPKKMCYQHFRKWGWLQRLVRTILQLCELKVNDCKETLRE